jgi:hypothetical protein
MTDLYDVHDRTFTEEEINFLKKMIPKKYYTVKYCIWKQVRKNNLYIAFVIDYFPDRVRACAADQALEVFATRKLSDKEYQEEIENFGCNHRVMKIYNYNDVDWLLEEDSGYGVTTPPEFVNECRKRGYNNTPDLFSFNYNTEQL